MLEGRQLSELVKSDGIMSALLEIIELGLAQPHMSIQSEHALTRIVEGFKTYRFKSQILAVASQQVYGLLLGVFRMSP